MNKSETVRPAVRPADVGGVHRDPEFLKQLIHNRKYHLLGYTRKDGTQFVWFLSLSDNGRLYRVVIERGRHGQTLDMFADQPSRTIERTYYKAVSESFGIEPFRAEIKLPRKGKRDLIIDPVTRVKLDLKHEIGVQDLLAALRVVPQQVQYQPNNSTAYLGRDSFIFFLDIGRPTPLELVMVYENNTYVLVTAYFPEAYPQKN